MDSTPREMLIVTFFEHPCMAARVADGTIVMSVGDVCTAVGLNTSSQLRRLRQDEDLRDGLHTLRVPTAGGEQEREFLILEFIPEWITHIKRNRASPVVRERLRYLRLFSIRQVYDALMQAAQLPEGASRAIEDLQDLARYDEAVQGIAERQQALETSQERAREVWKDHETRLRQLEAHIHQSMPLTNAQRGHVYELVQYWARARVAYESLSSSAAFAGCWGVIKTRYHVAKYEHIPSAQFDDCVAFIRRSYEKLTGEELSLDQLRMNFDD